MFLTIIGCEGPFPGANGACSGYLLESDSGKTRIMLEMGCGTLSRLRDTVDDVTKLDAVILSHLHYDHMCDMPVLGYLLDFSQRESMRVICPQTPELNRTILQGKFAVENIADTVIGEFKAEFMKVIHPVETYAIKLTCDGKTFVYTGDTNDCEGLEVFAKDCDLLLADCGLSVKNHTDRKPHMSPIGCAKLAALSNAKRLILTHLSPLNDKKELLTDAKSVFKDCELAEIGMRVKV